MSFILDLLASTAENVEVAGLEQALENYHIQHPEKWNTAATVLLAAAGVIGELEAGTKSSFLKKLEEGLITAVNAEITAHPVTP